jgi:2-polyprenyl-3-methyl-5-hydroxy-6-metoxy-1,4-benzoquinol methylase
MIVDEHFVPKDGLDLEPYLRAKNTTAVHHLIRYLWAERCLADIKGLESVLDVACGSGYGSFVLSKRFPGARVVGADYDPGAVEVASSLYSAPNLEYRVGDVTRWDETIGPDVVDAVVSFDTIEHVIHRDIMMESTVKHLRDDGVLLLSTPCGRDVNNLKPGWEHHRIEYSSASLYDFVSRYFQEILRPDDGAVPHLNVFDVLQGSGVHYWLKMNPVLCRGPIRVVNPYR